MAGVSTETHLIRRGDIWITDLRPGVGREVAKKRPTLVISINPINSISPTVIVIPISSRIPTLLGPERIFLSASESMLEKDSVILNFHIRAVDKKRLSKKISSLSKTKMKEVEEALKLVLDLP
ncbi:MAG: type II toxin-antitoxin system PemK/MazF family toxin [Candidatus Levyibacteriota bacterium]